MAVFKQFPDVEHDTIALDREFETQEERLDARIDDLNNNKVHDLRILELFHENFYENEDGIVKYSTFLTYALTKLHTNQLRDLLKKLEPYTSDRFIWFLSRVSKAYKH